MELDQFSDGEDNNVSSKVSFFWDPSQDMEFKQFPAQKYRSLIGRPNRSANQSPVFSMGNHLELVSWLLISETTDFSKFYIVMVPITVACCSDNV